MKELAKERAYKINVNKIKGLIAERGITRKDVAEQLSIASTSLYNKLSGLTSFTADEICVLASFFEKEPGIFFTL